MDDKSGLHCGAIDVRVVLLKITWVLKKDIMRPSRGLSRALPAVSRRTRWEAGSRQPSRESPYGLEATGYCD